MLIVKFSHQQKGRSARNGSRPRIGTTGLVENCLRQILAQCFTGSQAALLAFNPLTPLLPYECTAINNPVPDQVKLSFVIFDI